MNVRSPELNIKWSTKKLPKRIIIKWWSWNRIQESL